MTLEKDGYDVFEAKDGEEALLKFKDHEPDLLILDVVMPNLDGYSVCKKIRETSSVPILFLSSRQEEVDRIIGLESGGDDYIAKPFSPRELLLKISIIRRRTNGISIANQQLKSDTKNQESPSNNCFKKNQFILDFQQYCAFYKNEKINLTATEFEILKVLAATPQKIFSRDELMDFVYGNDIVVTDRTIDTHIKRLRQKFAKFEYNPIETAHGIGYRISV